MGRQIFCTSCIEETLFDGTPEEAEAAGWVENEFGFVCPECADFDSAHELDGTVIDPLTDNLVARAVLDSLQKN